MTDYAFLRGGGEMGELTRQYNWAASPVGDPSEWPQSLRLTVSMILKSKFPMFLWWGDDLIQFYNDAYRPSLGNTGKHPTALGQKGKDCWPEIWQVIHPLIEHVKTTGEGTWSEDQLIPIYRNGKIEDVYWTFGYSAIGEESGHVGGVLVICTETTEKVLSRHRLEESEQRFRTMAEGADLLIAISDETSNATYFNKAWTDFTGRSMEELLHFGWADRIHEDDRQDFVNLYLAAFKKQESWKGQFRMLNKKGEYQWLLGNGSPRLRNDGSFAGYITSSIDINEQMVAQRQVEQNELDLRNMVLEAPIGICVLDAASLICEIVNDKFIEVAGKPYEAIVGKYYWESFAEVRSAFEGALANVVTNGEPFEVNEVELMLIRSGREESIYVSFVYAPLKDLAGNVKKVAVWVIENTQQVVTRQKIVESEQEIRSLIEAAPFPIGVYRGREMRIAFANQSIMDVWGKGENVIGKLFSEVLPELDNQAVFRQLDDVYTSGTPFHIKNQRLDINFGGKARVFYFNYSLTPLFDSKGKIYGVMNTGVDITELNLAKREVEKSEQNLRNTILQSPVAMCIFRGIDFVVEIANDRMIELWGKPKEAVINKPIFVGLPEAAAQGFEDMLNGVYRTGKTFSAEGMPITLPRNGKIENVFVNFVYEAYREADGSVSGILAVAIEVTAQVLARQQIEQVVAERTKELEEANSNLQKSNAELGQFAYIASHDLQEPIRKISTFAQLLDKNLSTSIDDKDKSYIQKIRSSSTRMQSLIRDVLSYSELVRENETFGQVDLNEILDAAKTDFELLIEQKQAVINSVNLPIVEAIPLQMSQLLNNLLANALKFSRTDISPLITIKSEKINGAQLPVHLSAEKSIDYYHITFKDNGIGFEPDYAEQIFSIFKRLHRKSEFEGTGIGLAMCRKIAQNHHGFLDADGSSTSGAVFNIYLPAEQPKN